MCTKASFKIQGGKVGILLLHRLCGTPVEMRFVASGLARSGYTVSCPQLAGHCGSLANLRASTWRDWYASAEAALLELAEECETVIVGGLSTGAILAVMLAARHPKLVKGTALLAPTLWLNGWMIPWYARLFRLIQHKWVADLFKFPHHAPHGIKDARIREFIQRAREAHGSHAAGHPVTPGAAVYEHGRLAREVAKLAHRVSQPSLIIHPAEDDYAALNNATFLKDSIGGATELLVLDDCYHIVTVDRQRHQVVEAVIEFVGGLVAGLGTAEAQTGSEQVALQAA